MPKKPKVVAFPTRAVTVTFQIPTDDWTEHLFTKHRWDERDWIAAHIDDEIQERHRGDHDAALMYQNPHEYMVVHSHA